MVGYFYYSGFDLICENIKDKNIRILVGLEVDVKVTSRIKEVDRLQKINQSRGQIKEDYYASFVKLFIYTDFYDSRSKIESFELFYSKILDGTLEIRKTEDPCHAKMYLFEYNESISEGGDFPGTVITGVIVSDVVGLGKSIIGSTVARNMRLKTIIISPRHLKSQWDEYKDEFGFTATVFSSGQIESALKHYRKIAERDEQFLIIIDEAHKYRNEYTQDYANLHNLCLGNKVILLTATPFNNRPEDIYSMLKLFQIPTKSTLKTVENLGAAFKDLIKAYAQLTKEQREGKKSEEDVKHSHYG